MPAQPRHKAWLDGRVLDPEHATVSIFTQTALRGANVYEGIRAYWSEERHNLYVWKLDPHLRRLFQSMKIMRMVPPYTAAELQQGVLDWIRANGFREDIHFRLVVYFGDGGHAGVRSYKPGEIDFGAFIIGGPRPHQEALERGLHLCVSSWRRIGDETTPPRVKAGANYQNNRLAAVEARVNGYDDAIMLNQDGKVAEATGACVMIVRDGVPITPPVTESLLESITRRTLLGMFETHLRRSPAERPIDRTELYIADEVFLCGSAEEVTPVVSMDRIPVGEGVPGPITRELQAAFFQAARGHDPAFEKDLLPVY
jgi:branched-chain amino acid aminotransferase